MFFVFPTFVSNAPNETPRFSNATPYESSGDEKIRMSQEKEHEFSEILAKKVCLDKIYHFFKIFNVTKNVCVYYDIFRILILCHAFVMKINCHVH